MSRPALGCRGASVRKPEGNSPGVALHGGRRGGSRFMRRPILNDWASRHTALACPVDRYGAAGYVLCVFACKPQNQAGEPGGPHPF